MNLDQVPKLMKLGKTRKVSNRNGFGDLVCQKESLGTLVTEPLVSVRMLRICASLCRFDVFGQSPRRRDMSGLDRDRALDLAAFVGAIRNGSHTPSALTIS